MTTFSIGDSIRFKDGVQHADMPMDIGGWQGRITKFEPADTDNIERVTVELDSITLQSLTELYILDSEIEGLGWNSYMEGITKLEPCPPRDKPEDVKRVSTALRAQNNWLHNGTDFASEAQLARWQALLDNNLTYPFRAIVDKFRTNHENHVPGGSRVRILGLAGYDKKWGILVNVKYKYTQAIIPLFDLSRMTEATVQPDAFVMFKHWFEIYYD